MLESTRVVEHDPAEASFHIFLQLRAAITLLATLSSTASLTSPPLPPAIPGHVVETALAYAQAYIANIGVADVASISVEEGLEEHLNGFVRTCKSFDAAGLPKPDQLALWQVPLVLSLSLYWHVAHHSMLLGDCCGAQTQYSAVQRDSWRRGSR